MWGKFRRDNCKVVNAVLAYGRLRGFDTDVYRFITSAEELGSGPTASTARKGYRNTLA
jgi:Iap family predicted aminopeptidase